MGGRFGTYGSRTLKPLLAEFGSGAGGRYGKQASLSAMRTDEAIKKAKDKGLKVSKMTH
jgi:hypothetical protein